MRQEIVTITKTIKDNNELIGSIGAYAFGSATKPNSTPNDIDILIIYGELRQPELIRRLLEDIGHMPIHLTFMYEQEEIEMNFISAQSCMSIL